MFLLVTLKNKRGEVNFHDVSMYFIQINVLKILSFQHVAVVTIHMLDNHLWPVAIALVSTVLE